MTNCDVDYYVKTGFSCRKHGKRTDEIEAWNHARSDPFTGQIENRLDIILAILEKIHSGDGKQ